MCVGCVFCVVFHSDDLSLFGNFSFLDLFYIHRHHKKEKVVYFFGIFVRNRAVRCGVGAILVAESI